MHGVTPTGQIPFDVHVHSFLQAMDHCIVFIEFLDYCSALVMNRPKGLTNLLAVHFTQAMDLVQAMVEVLAMAMQVCNEYDDV